MKIVSWNINGLRSQKNSILSILTELSADILCIQETKLTRDHLEETLALVDGYYSFFSFSRKRNGYSGVATYCKKAFAPAFGQEGLSGILNNGCLLNNNGSPNGLCDSWNLKSLKDLDSEGRCFITQHKFIDQDGHEQLLSILNVYCPRADPDSPERADYKLQFYKLLKERASILSASGSYVIIVGDVNTSHRRIDHCDPDDDPDFDKRPWRQFLNDFLLDISACGANGPSPLRRDCDTSTLKSSHGFLPPGCKEGKSTLNQNDGSASDREFLVIDTFRYFYPSQKGAFTCWNTKTGARVTNYGTRIDYILCDNLFVQNGVDAYIYQDYLGSDHCPISFTISDAVTFLSSVTIPSTCTRFYPEFQGSQQKLSSYFKACSEGKTEEAKGKMQGKKLPNKRLKCSNGQTTLKSFFLPTNKKENDDKNSGSSCYECDVELDTRPVDYPKDTQPVDYPDYKQTSNADWHFLMKGPPQPPLCSGHSEISVVKTVKKKGTNFNRQFYCCSRGIGKESDPNTRCNFFKWLSR